VPASAAADTWGISGPTFLLYFVVAAVLAFATTTGLRWMLRRGQPATAELHPYEIACLSNRELAVTASLAAFRVDDVIEVGSDGLKIISRDPGAQTPLDEAVLHAIDQGTHSRVGTLALHPKVTRALYTLENRLRSQGLMTGDGLRTRYRLATIPLGLVIAIGLARLVSGIAGGKPVLFLVLLLVPVTIGWVALLLIVRLPQLTRAGVRELVAAQTRHRALNPSASPAWSTNGSDDMALAVALFGESALHAYDPEFAQVVTFQSSTGRLSTSSYSTSSSSSSSTSSYSCSYTSSSCSSSSCSSSSCGSSSCGSSGCGG
jgi:uncharacterized protein (TIGR04222 family)